MIRIYSRNDELELENVNIDFRNSSVYLGREYSDSVSIALKGSCGYDTIKKIIELKEKLGSTWSADMHFGKETLTYGRLTMSSLDFRYESENSSFSYEIRLASETRKDA